MSLMKKAISYHYLKYRHQPAQKQDPDYASWGKDPASVNYIGLIAYFVKANTELHERVKALGSN